MLRWSLKQDLIIEPVIGVYTRDFLALSINTTQDHIPLIEFTDSFKAWVVTDNYKVRVVPSYLLQFR